MKSTIFKIIFTATIPITLFSCNNNRSVKFISKIKSVKASENVDLIISSSVKEFKASGFRYGDLIRYTFTSKDTKEKFSNVAPFVFNYSMAGIFNSAICDFEKSGHAISLSLGATDAYDKIDDTYIDQEIVFTLEKSDGWKDLTDKLHLSNKRTFNIVGRDNKIYTNSRDIKIVDKNLSNPKFLADTVYRLSAPFDDVLNSKRYEYSDDIIRYLMQIDKYTLLVNVNYNDHFTDYDGFKFYDRLYDKTLTPEGNNKSIMMIDKKPRIKGKDDNAISFNTGDNFFSLKNKNQIRNLIKTDYGPSDDKDAGMLNYLSGCEEKKYRIFLCGADGIQRTGFLILLFEALAGASYDTIVADYMVSYKNYYNIIPYADTLEEYNMIKSLTVDRFLYALCTFQDSDNKFKSTDWNDYLCATNYLNNIKHVNDETTFVDEAERYIQYLFDNNGGEVIEQLRNMVAGKAIKIN